MHLSLPRKWRPREFDALVGQEAVVRTLQHAVESGRVNHAYLFTGPRGVGKTTTARLLAACLNCVKGPATIPCGECPSCVEIASRGESLDTIELDAASNRSVDNARELIEILRYAPQRDRYRILILDEVHMLTREAFNALLKTIEEPPERAVFILASTELHKIPATIISRCQRFSFRRLSESEINEHLQKVAGKESISLSAGAAASIARAADGSLRDALSLLDQASTLSGGTVDERRCAEIFAFADQSALDALFASVVSGDRSEVVAILDRFRQEGLDPRHGSRELLSSIREILLASARNRDDAGGDRLSRLSRLAPYETLLRLASLALEAERQLSRSADPWITWEMSLLRMSEAHRLHAIEDVISQISSGEPSPGSSAALSAGPRFVSLVAAPAAESRDAAPVPSPSQDAGKKFLRLLEARRVTVATYASLATRIREIGDDLEIEFPIDKASAKDSLQRPDAARLLAEAAREAFGRPLTIRLVTGPPANGDLAAAAREVAPQVLSRERASSRAQEDPMVQKAMELFRGEVVEVKEKK
jgi:DNA polymerase-3 subunit gamma/tau